MLSSLSLGAFSAPASSGVSGSSGTGSAAAPSAAGATAAAAHTKHTHHRPRTLSTAEATALPATATQSGTVTPRGSLLDLLA